MLNMCCMDSRTTEEFNKGHIHHAANIPFMFVREEKVCNSDIMQ